MKKSTFDKRVHFVESSVGAKLKRRIIGSRWGDGLGVLLGLFLISFAFFYFKPWPGATGSVNGPDSSVPDFAAAHNNLGLALDHKGQYDAAIAEYREALRLNPGLGVAH